MNRIYFPGLNELRCIAAFMVIIHHIEIYKSVCLTTASNPILNHFFETLGRNGVYLFFTLSGFLITFLLLKEIEIGDVNIKKFYIRRILRIWPVYYLIVIITFCLLPNILIDNSFFSQSNWLKSITDLHFGYKIKLILFILFLPNVALRLFDPILGISQAWSVGVEEQFYLFWPLIINAFKKNILFTLLMLIIFKAIFIEILKFFINLQWHPVLNTMIDVLIDFKIELMALGGISAYFLYNNLEWFLNSQYLKRKNSCVIIILIIISIIVEIHYMIQGCLFCLFILLTVNKESNILNSKILAFIGRISYGMYMYHMLVLYFVFEGIKKFNVSFTCIEYNFFLYFLIITITILLSYISYEFMEKPVLKFKKTFIVVQSGNQ